jgi:hypothetical protein
MHRLITAAELQNRTLSDLQDLYRKVEAELVRSPRGSAQRRSALASLENIARAIAKMRACHLRPRF